MGDSLKKKKHVIHKLGMGHWQRDEMNEREFSLQSLWAADRKM